MTRDEAIQLMSTGETCFYKGQFRHLRNKRWYIKEVTQRAAIVNLTPGPRDYKEFHILGLEHLITDSEWKLHQGRDCGC